MDTISVKDIAVFAYHGVMQEENVVGQKFLISAELGLDTSIAGENDDIEESVDYAQVCSIIKNYAENNTFSLIEALAEGLAKCLLLEYTNINSVDIEVKKPWAPVHIPVDTVSVKISRKWHDVYLSIGSNMGDKKHHLDLAVERLDDTCGIQVCETSDYIVTAPVGGVEQEDFLNAAVHIRTILSPNSLLDIIHDIENMDGRKRDIHWGTRTIDIDIILYDDIIISERLLKIPHPEAHKREFVLKPLSQIAENVMHPILGKSIGMLYNGLLEKQMCTVHEQFDSDFKSIDTLAVDKNTRIAFFGEEGTYSQQAMERFFGKGGYISFSRPSFTDVMQAVCDGEADYGVVPIENSSTGGITDIYDHMHDYNIYIVGEQIIKIEHALLGLPGSSLSDIRRVYSHSQGIRQCSAFFKDNPDITPIAVANTITGAKTVLMDNDISQAAIAAESAAELYGLKILKNRVNEQDNNSTRFIILSSRKEYVRNSGKISISFEAKHESGALYRILSHFYQNGINLEKIESRPIPNRTWEYRFFVDIDGNLQMQSVKNALGGVCQESEGMNIIGNY